MGWLLASMWHQWRQVGNHFTIGIKVDLDHVHSHGTCPVITWVNRLYCGDLGSKSLCILIVSSTRLQQGRLSRPPALLAGFQGKKASVRSFQGVPRLTRWHETRGRSALEPSACPPGEPQQHNVLLCIIAYRLVLGCLQWGISSTLSTSALSRVDMEGSTQGW